MAKLTGTPAPDELVGTLEDDMLLGLDGDDRLHGGLGDDLLVGGRGDDRLDGGSGVDRASWGDAPGRGSGGFHGMWISLAAGVAEAVTGRDEHGFWQRDPVLERDALVGIENATGTTHHDHVEGDAGRNTLHGLAGRDEVEGLGGDDTLAGDAGDDGLRGGDGDDLLYGGTGADQLEGGPGDDRAYAGPGDDRLLGDLGDDLLHGGDGDDRFSDGSLEPEAPEETGNDRYDGGAGVDTVDYHELSFAAEGQGGVLVLLSYFGVSAGWARHGEEADRLVGIENVVGTDRDDVLSGNAADNVLTGLGGDDRLFGRGGDDVLVVGSEPGPGGANLADGGAGDDTLLGWGGSDDRLLGGQGADLLGGGAHALAEAADQDRLDLGQDAAQDRVVHQLGRSIVGLEGGGVDRVLAFDPLLDLLAVEMHQSSAFGDVSLVDARDFLDSNDDGLLNDDDQELSALGADLVLDLGAVWERAFAADLPDDRPQQLVLAGIGSLSADRVTIPDLEPGWSLVAEPPDPLF